MFPGADFQYIVPTSLDGLEFRRTPKIDVDNALVRFQTFEAVVEPFSEA